MTEAKLLPMPPAAPVPYLALGVPSFDTVMTDFAFSLAAVAASTRARIGFLNGRSSIVANARNNIVHAAQEIKAEWLLFLDSDMVFPVFTAQRLLSYDRDIVCALYRRRVPNPETGVFEVPGKPLGDGQARDGLIEMEIAPTGCMLIRMSVFDRLRRPYFRFGVNEELGIVQGEDVTFCHTVRALGYRLWADMGLSQEIGHIGQQIVWTGGAEPANVMRRVSNVG